jgi:uncharacterized protein YbaA (DUF1428 family)
MTYFDGYLIPIAPEKFEAYRAFSAKIALVYREYGALRIVDCVLDRDVEGGEQFHAEAARENLGDTAALRDFNLAADANADETVILSWTEWPDKQARDLGLKKALADPRVQPAPGEETLFEGRRLVAGSFRTLVDL